MGDSFPLNQTTNVSQMRQRANEKRKSAKGLMDCSDHSLK